LLISVAQFSINLRIEYNMKPLYIDVGKDENDRYPLCPHCGSELRTITDYRSHLKFMSNMHVFCCSKCNTALGVTAVSK